jgi:hypothetical protein
MHNIYCVDIILFHTVQLVYLRIKSVATDGKELSPAVDKKTRRMLRCFAGEIRQR